MITLARTLVLALIAGLCSATAAWADPPGRVGRVGEIDGQVWLYSPDAGEWTTAVRNRPLTTGDRLATESNARVEVRIGSTTVRLDAGTELEVLRIDDELISLHLHNGSVATRIRSADAAREFELRTTEGRFTANRPGRYRFDRQDDTSFATVWSGEAVYEGPNSALTVQANQRAEFWLDRNNVAQYSLGDPERDAFASWSSDRDRYDERSASTRYVSPEMTGVEDLDRHGRWEQVAEYGPVWYPRVVPAGWAPYRTGHWVWVSPWGWTWVDEQPWGFAPFHYGRWVMHRHRWCWVPGTYVRRPVYAPALVGWVGGSNVSVSVSIGNSPAVGWFPLAPREVYVPSYRVSPRYVQQVNVTHVTNITNVTTIINNPQQVVTHIDYRNRRHPHAVTVVPQTVLINRQPVAPAHGRNIAAVQQFVGQPAQRVVVVAPPVAAPVVDPIRRRHGGGDAARPAAPGVQVQPGAAAQAAIAAPAVIPPPPSRMNSPAGRALKEIQERDAAREHDRRDLRDRVRVPDAVRGDVPDARRQAPAASMPAPGGRGIATVNPAAPGVQPSAAARPPVLVPAPQGTVTVPPGVNAQPARPVSPATPHAAESPRPPSRMVVPQPVQQVAPPVVATPAPAAPPPAVPARPQPAQPPMPAPQVQVQPPRPAVPAPQVVAPVQPPTRMPPPRPPVMEQQRPVQAAPPVPQQAPVQPVAPPARVQPPAAQPVQPVQQQDKARVPQEEARGTRRGRGEDDAPSRGGDRRQLN